MFKGKKEFELKNDYLIVDDEKYEVLEELKYIVKILHEEECYRVRLHYLYKYYDYIYHNVSFIANAVKLMPLSFLKQILLDDDIECFNDLNNK